MRLTETEFHRLRTRVEKSSIAIPKKTGPNKTEQRWVAEVWQRWRQIGLVRPVEPLFASVTLVVVEYSNIIEWDRRKTIRRRYTPDWLILDALGSPVFIEIKGAHIREDAEMKFHLARMSYPWFTFQCWQYANRQWTEIWKSS